MKDQIIVLCNHLEIPLHEKDGIYVLGGIEVTEEAESIRMALLYINGYVAALKALKLIEVQI